MTLLRKPVSIVLIGLYYLLSPVLNLAQIASVTHLSLSGPVNLWSVLTPFDWVVLGAFPLVGVGMLTVRRWGWVTFVAFSLFLIGYNSFSFFINHTYSLGLVVLYNVGLAAVTFVFFRKHLRAPYFNPRLRWWNIDPRYPVLLTASLEFADSSCDVEVLDISKSGVFLGTCADIEVGQTHRVKIVAYGQTVRCTGKVMRRSAPGAAKPGFGLMFENLDPGARNDLRVLLAKLVQEGARERGLPEDAPLARDPFLKHVVWQAKRLGRELVGA